MHKILNKTNVKAVATALILSLTLTSCSVFKRDTSAEPVDNSVVVVNDINDLAEDSFYVGKSNGKFYKLYISNTSFSLKRGENSVTPSNVAWFKEDYDKIPTMKQGDYIVYHSSSLLTQELHVNRMYDLGYTFGIAKLEKQKNQDYYYFSTIPDKLNVMPNSSASQTLELNAEKVVLDKVGETPIRSGNVSPAGTVKGLEKDNVYKAYIYKGTKAHQYDIAADARTLAMAEKDTLKKYEFFEENTVRFQFPAYYNPGYYLVEGFGVVKYIKDNEKFDEGIDMNIPNVYPTKEQLENGDDLYDTTEYVQTDDIIKQNFTALEDGMFYVNVKYNNEEDKEKGYKPPTVKIVGTDSSTTLQADENGVFETNIELTAGDYEIHIIGLNGRNYTYKAISAAAKEEDTNNSDIVTNDPNSKEEGNADSSGEDSNNQQTKDSNDKPSMADLVNGD